VSSGLLGLAYSLSTGAFNGTNVWVDNNSNHIVYDSIIASIFSQHQIPAKFSFALSRDESGNGNAGVLTLGGTPRLRDPHVNVTGDFVSVPLEAQVDQMLDRGTPELQQYGITVQGLYYGHLGRLRTNNNAVQYIVDSGTSLNFVPTLDAANFNAMFDPPAIRGSDGTYLISCNATAPSLAYMIGGKLFRMNPKDLVIGYDQAFCQSGVQDGGATPPYILGDIFHRNVLAVYDWENDQMQ
jgi:hypothetical protein